MNNTFFDEPFDEVTLDKLDLYRQYLSEWLPVFVAARTRFCDTVNIFDFFAGRGMDCNGVKGSPLIAHDIIFTNTHYIRTNNINMNLYLNDAKESDALQTNITNQGKPKRPFSLQITNLDFQAAFDKYYPIMQRGGTANLIFLDQFGYKHITDDVFKRILNLGVTDIIFFISSSAINRFRKETVVKQYVDLEADGIGTDNSNYIHREICNHYRVKIPRDKQYFLGHFSLKRGPNVYGLIFGTGHLLGMEKFVRACWRKDSLRGEANYDIDSDCINPDAPSIFADMNKPSRLQHFEAELENLILGEKLLTNKDIYVFTVTNGILPRIARDKLKAMISTGLLPGQKVLVSWDAYKSKLSKRIELN